MPRADTDFVQHLIERLDRLDPNSVQGYILKLVREKGLLETIFQTIREGVIIIDRDLKIEFVNQAAMNLLGLPQNVLDEGQRISRFLRDLDWERLMSQDPDEWERVSRQEIEVNYPRYRSILFYLLPYRNQFAEDDQLGMAIIILHDVTELRERTFNEIESERLNAITMLAAGVAHEIGNPLNSLTIHLQLLERLFRDLPASDDREEGRELVSISLQEVRRLDQIINSFLKAVRPTPMEVQSVSLKELVEETLRVMKVEIEDRDIHIECEWPVPVPSVQADPDQIKQVIYNIVKNSMQATESGGKLRIALVTDDNAVRLQIADNGKGIAPDELSNIFNPYYTTREGGTGLGLVIVERIIRDHGADLGVESELGKGTVFTISFPLRSRRRRLLESPDIPLPIEPQDIDSEQA